MTISSIFFDRQFGRALIAFGLSVALIASALLPAIASAAQLTERSITLSSSSANADDVTYEVKFTAAGAATAVVVDFCENSPLLSAACDAPAGLDVNGATAAGFTPAALEDNTLALSAGTIATGANTITIEGINNPTGDGTIYARVVTYNGSPAGYVSGTPGAHVDDGSVALFITNTIGVSGAVLESMTFCVSGTTIADGCASTTSPTLQLGEEEAGVVALSADDISTGHIFTQLSTNSAGGAVVNLKSSAAGCGGLLRAGDAEACDIAPALVGGILEGQARFGLLATAVAGGSGTLQAITGYNASTYVLNYDEDELTGVTSTFGDPVLNTNGLPAVNKNMDLTFGASISANTPAGLYSTDLSLIATGKF